ncbi:hypothetical protein [Candidatus Nitrososphaera evergladensis]|uniref:ApeA N-terminal domain 1-containing protein n=1 Tax=Candidatus Nitrososphaera evergladensis TaxID=1459637 RepID=UPI0011E5DDFD
MLDAFEFKGAWWLPDHPDKKIPGVLKFHQSEGAILDLIGSFRTVNDNKTSFETVYGVNTDGKSITLFKVLESNLKFNGAYFSKYISTFIFEGGHFPKYDDIMLKSMSVSYSYLDEWIEISRLHLDDINAKSYTFTYTSPPPVQLGSYNGFDVEVVSSARSDFTLLGQRDFSLKQSLFIKINSTKE